MFLVPAYRPHQTFVAPARRRSEFWRLIVSAVLIVTIYVAPLAALSAGLAMLYGPRIADGLTRRVVEGATPGAMLVTLFTFAGLAIGTMAAARLVHRRSAATLFGPSARAALRDFLRVFGPLVAFELLVAALALTDPAIQPGLSPVTFIAYLPFSLSGILLQVGSEELLFRGYLQQQLAARFRSPAIWMGVPSMLFAWGHYLPEEFGAGALMIVLWAFVFGCLAADLTARTGNLGAALAFHAANNLSAMLFIGLRGNLDGLALWTIEVDLSDGATLPLVLAVDFLMMFSGWLLARLVLRR